MERAAKKRIIAQSIVLPDKACSCRGLYFRTSGTVRMREGGIELQGGSMLKTDTYMNLLDAGTWLRYTGVEGWTLRIRVCGKGELRLMRLQGGQESVMQGKAIDTGCVQDILISFTHCENDGIYYFELLAGTQMYVKDACYLPEIDTSGYREEIKLGLIICTYRRREALDKNLAMLMGSRFFDTSSPLYGKLRIYVVDNASELPRQEQGFLHIYHNPNTGGSGGFTRGIKEIRKDRDTYGFTNIIFMDDDVEVSAETFYRLYALLSLVKEEYRREVVAGRMFRMDRRQVQYTAAEIWNGGNLLHVGWNLDMEKRQNLIQVNDNSGAQYGGWWFAAFPMQFVEENTPLPFFLHCDDVEYGLRHGGTPIILNGIQVWHETYEYRQSPMISYYDTRNPLIVNSIYGFPQDPASIIGEWKAGISCRHADADYRTEYMMIRAMWDFVKGPGWFLKTKPGQLHERRQNKKRNPLLLRFGNALFWRVTGQKARFRMEAVRKQYQLQLKAGYF